MSLSAPIEPTAPRGPRNATLLFAALLAVGVIAAFALFDPVGVLTSRAAWFLFMVATALALFALFEGFGRRELGLMIGALTLGGAAQLHVTRSCCSSTLIAPGLNEEAAMYLIVAIQGVFSFRVVRRHLSADAYGRALRALGRFRLLLWLSLGVAFSYPVMIFVKYQQMDLYALHLFFGALLIVINGLTLLGIALTSPPRLRLPRRASLLPVFATVFLAFAVVMALFAFERVAHVADEFAYVFQARTYAGGSLWVPAPPPEIVAAFDYYLLDTHEGRWISAFTPGWPAVLTIGELLGASWLVNPVLGVVCLLLGYALAREVSDAVTAAVTVLLLALSPWLIAMSASLMSHTLGLALVVFAWTALFAIAPRLGLAGAVTACFVAGLAMGWLFLTRNLDGLVVGALTGLYLFVHSASTRRAGIIVGYGSGCVATGGLIFLYNAYFTGDPLRTTLSDYYARYWGEGANAFGFGQGVGTPETWGDLVLWPQEHSLAEGIINALNAINVLHTDLMGWGIGSLALFWAYLVWGEKQRFDGFLLVVAAGIVIAHLFYWYNSFDYIGARYYFLTVFPLAYLSAKGVLAVAARLRAAGFETAHFGLGAALFALCGFSVVVFLSYRGVTRYYEHRFLDDDYRSLTIPVDTAQPAPLVIVSNFEREVDYLFFNDPHLRPNRPVFAKDLGTEGNRDLRAFFSDRPVLYYNERAGEFFSP